MICTESCRPPYEVSPYFCPVVCKDFEMWASCNPVTNGVRCDHARAHPTRHIAWHGSGVMAACPSANAPTCHFCAMGIASDAQRWSIVLTWKTCRNISQTARLVGVSRKVARRWVQRYVSTNNVLSHRKSGGRCILDQAATRRALQLLIDVESSGAHGVALQLHREGYTSTIANRRTIVRAAKTLARKEGRPIEVVRSKPAKRLTADTKAKRLAFCKLHKRTCWSKVMFTDRKKFLFSYPGAKVKPVAWVYKGCTRQASQVNHPLCVNLYAGITTGGITLSHVVAGTSKQRSTYFNKQGKQSKNITSSEYKEVLLKTLLPEGQRLFGTRGESVWVLQQDNDPSHRVAAEVVKQWNNSHVSSIHLLSNWPPNSPDLNPIENVWSYVQAKVNNRGCATFEDFKRAVLEEVHGVPKSMLIRLFKSMPKRLAQVMAKEGDKIKY